MISSGSVRVEADREGVDAGEGLEDDALAFGDRQGGLGRAALAAEDVGAVGEDGDRVAAAGEIERGEGILADRQAGFGHAGGVDQGEDRAVADRHLAVDADQAPIASAVVEALIHSVELLGSILPTLHARMNAHAP